MVCSLLSVAVAKTISMVTLSAAVDTSETVAAVAAVVAVGMDAKSSTTDDALNECPFGDGEDEIVIGSPLTLTDLIPDEGAPVVDKYLWSSVEVEVRESGGKKHILSCQRD